MRLCECNLQVTKIKGCFFFIYKRDLKDVYELQRYSILAKYSTYQVLVFHLDRFKEETVRSPDLSRRKRKGLKQKKGGKNVRVTYGIIFIFITVLVQQKQTAITRHAANLFPDL